MNHANDGIDKLINPYKNRQLFLDDHSVYDVARVSRVLHQPSDRVPVLRPDTKLGQISTQSASSPVWNEKLSSWECWYWAMYDEQPGNMYASEGRINHYARSNDGMTWNSPNLGLYNFRGSRNNNVAYDTSQTGLALYHVIRDELESDPARRYKGLFATSERFIDRVPSFSPDGFKWTFPDSTPIPSKDTSKFFHDKEQNLFIGTVKHGTEWGRSVWIVTSEDFIHWTDPRLVLHSDLEDRENRKRRIDAVVADPDYISPPIVDGVDYLAEIYQMPICKYEGIYIGFPMIFNPAGAVPPPHGNFTALNQTELAVSRDLYNWERVANRDIFLGVQPWDGQTFETAQLSVCGPPIRHGDELWIYYGASRFRGPIELYRDIPDKYFQQRGALCLGKLRIDGFVSLDGDSNGEIITAPFVANGGELYANVNAINGSFRAEIVDCETMEPLTGFFLSDSQNITGDHTAVVLKWNAVEIPTRTKPVRVRFSLNKASLYSFWVKEM